MSILESARAIDPQFRAVFLSAGAPPMVQGKPGNPCVPVDGMRPVINSDVVAAYQELQSDSSIKIMASAQKTDRRGSMSVSVRGKGRYRVDWYHQRSSLSMTLRPIPFETKPWESLWGEDALRNGAQLAQQSLEGSAILWVCSPMPMHSHVAMDALFDAFLDAGGWSKLLKIDAPLRHLHASRVGTLAEQIEVGVDCASLDDAATSVVSSGCDVAFVDVPWMRPADVHAAVSTMLDDGVRVVARAKPNTVPGQDPTLFIDESAWTISA